MNKESSPAFVSGSNPLLIVLSGPSGVGKDTILARIKELGHPFYYVVTATTRPQRSNEKDGKDYYFLTQSKFNDMVAKGEFLEWARVYDNFYGVPQQGVKEALARGQDVMVKVDVQGAATIKGIAPDAVFIFIAPPSVEDLVQRLRNRKSESTQDLTLRIETAHREMGRLPLFDYVIVNEDDKVDQAVAQIEAIITAEKCRVKPRLIEL